MRGDDATVSLVIAENGAVWPRFAQELQQRATHAVVESQSGSETPEVFAHRVAHRVYKLTAKGLALEFVVIAISERLDLEALDARQRLGRAIATAMSTNSSGELILSAAEHASDAIRHHLFTLAGSLMDDLAGSPVNVRVRFTSTSHSAVRVVRPSSPDVDVEAESETA
jgi:hypothetical protein